MRRGSCAYFGGGGPKLECYGTDNKVGYVRKFLLETWLSGPPGNVTKEFGKVWLICSMPGTEHIGAAKECMPKLSLRKGLKKVVKKAYH